MSSRDLEARLRAELAGEVAFDDYTRQLFARDASMYSIMPLGVVSPRDAADVAATVAVAGEFEVPVLARGAGTSLAGQTVGPGIVLDFSRHLNKIMDIDPEARTALVEPGVVQDQLNRAAGTHGLMFGPDTSTSNRATIGGMIGNNSAGSGSIRYGMTIDHVRELDVVLADATTAHNVLSRRLQTMVDAGLLRRSAYRGEQRTHHEYLLTKAGADLLPVLNSLALWGEKHTTPPSTDAHMTIVHTTCGQASRSADVCDSCGTTMIAQDTAWVREWKTPRLTALHSAAG